MDTQSPPEAVAPAGEKPRTASPSAPFHALDLIKEASIAKLTAGMSPASLRLALMDWLIHLAAAPGKRLELATLAAMQCARVAGYLAQLAAGTTPSEVASPRPGDTRFRTPAWQTEPFRFWQQSFLLAEQWWNAATHQIPGATHHHEDVVAFTGRQWLDAFAPTNFIATNPEVLARTLMTGGTNLMQGASNFADDMRRAAVHAPPAGVEQYRIGTDIAATPGRVVYRNRLIELIQYSPSTPDVLAEPILIVPAWIMKYYILDLSPHNSMIGYLVGEGHTVFCISWRNVDETDRDLGFDDYRRLGVMDALAAIGKIVPGRRVHGVGYCLGGTLLSIAAAAMANENDERLATVTLLAAQTDFTEPGELQLFIDESEVYFLEAMMWERGYLDAYQMSGSFRFLQSNDLVWSRVIRDYLLGERAGVTDLMAWNADSTRMPYRMHVEYLRELFLDNELASNHFRVDARIVSLHNLAMPLFVVGTERDHIAPWRSVYKIHYLTDAPTTFVLTAGGHNAGIVSEPGHPHRHFRIHSAEVGDPRIAADEWVEQAEPREGSWWPAWHQWLADHSDPERVPPPRMGLPGKQRATMEAAPGTYVFQK